nr:MAG: L1 protein [Leptonychotes weddellii papillomavirus 10]
MAVWRSNGQKLFLPPTPVATVPSTDDYVQRLNLFYHAESERLLSVGNPYFAVNGVNGTVKVQKVSPNQYRVFRAKLPDPNAFAFSDGYVYNAETERLVWALRGVEVSRGQPLGLGLSGHPLFNRQIDVENNTKGPPQPNKDNRQNMAHDVKQTQVLIVGCIPATGEHWQPSETCDKRPLPEKECPSLELANTVIQDGDMCDIGYGAMDFDKLQYTKADVPLDIVKSVCKYPDYIKMSKDVTGDSLFFFSRREQMYTRHFFTREGVPGEDVPDELYLKNVDKQRPIKNHSYFGTPSGSLVSSDAQIFNRPYWLQRAQGRNNGICWNNEVFVTVVDNTRGTVFNISVKKTAAEQEVYDAQNFYEFCRHCEEFELSFIFQLCKVALVPETLAHIQAIHPSVLDNWNLGLQPPQSTLLEDKYRYPKSAATPCPRKEPPKPPDDPYANNTFWNIDLTESFSADLDQYPLGRKFLTQTVSAYPPRKRKAPPSTRKPTTSKKRKK